MERRIIRDMSQSKEDFLFYLVNKLGYSDLKLAYNYTKDGETYYSKHIKYLDLMHLHQDEKIPGTFLTRRQFIAKASHRSVLDIELMLDIDEPEPYRDIKTKAKVIFQKLRKKSFSPSVYWTGSKSYHIGILIPEWREIQSWKLRDLKRHIIEFYGADGMKAGNCLISLESHPHWRSGQVKSPAIL